MEGEQTFLCINTVAFVPLITHQWEGPDLKRGRMTCGPGKTGLFLCLSLSPSFYPSFLPTSSPSPLPCLSLVQPFVMGCYKHWVVSRNSFVNTSLTQSEGRQPFPILDDFVHFLLFLLTVCGQDIDGDSVWGEYREPTPLHSEEGGEGENKGRVGGEIGVSGLFCAPPLWSSSDQSSSVSDLQGEIFSS